MISAVKLRDGAAAKVRHLLGAAREGFGPDDREGPPEAAREGARGASWWMFGKAKTTTADGLISVGKNGPESPTKSHVKRCQHIHVQKKSPQNGQNPMGLGSRRCLPSLTSVGPGDRTRSGC